jgi:acyl transferase domain-containing protein/acyl-CoA synthetase (AMP-forming)/AMP-acid ligase II/acyl carrier protein
LSKRISTPTFEHSTLVALLRWRAAQQPEQRVYSFLTDGEIERDHLTFAELDRQARIVAASLQESLESGARALLIYPSGLDFVAAFFGCLYSGIIAVPVYPPSAVRSDRSLTKFRAIANDVQPAVVLTTSSLSSRVEGLLAQVPELQGTRVIATNTLTPQVADLWREPALSSDSLAFFQYTSGSTGVPKGVMVTHGNLLHNSSLIYRYCKHPEDAHIVTWLPLYHDLGLIGGILQPVYAGFESTIMSPASFLQRPIRWLQAISRTRATLSGGPNFAYDLCVRKITEEQKATLDLSHWESAANGAEPIREETLERFAVAFASCGFRREAFLPCYGMAEATLVISAAGSGVNPLVGTFQGKELEHNRVVPASSGDQDSRQLVGIGNSLPDQQLIIVDPDSLTPCPLDRIGEIWVAGPSIAQGYWQKPEETEQTFRAYLAGSNEGPFLRTGDLGFLSQDQLFITGRLKDLIIIRGSNHYPQDIELTVEASHAALRPGCGVAFSVDVAGEERLVIVQEVERQYLHANLDEVIGAIRQAVAEQHELQTYAIVLVKTGSIPKTSSGKVQRRPTREAFLNGELDVVREWRLDMQDEQTHDVAEAHAAEPDRRRALRAETRKAEAIQSWLVEQVAVRLKVAVRDIDVQAPLALYGMDSVQAVSLAADLEDWLGVEISPTLAYDYPSIEAIAQHLAGTPATLDLPDRTDGQGRAGLDTIAIIGLGCRFPGADNPDEFWELLRNGVDGISEVPTSRWDLQRFYDPNRATPGKMNTRWGGFLKQVDQFDPYFFGISPREASRMDPQQRLLLEVAWEALEHAGQAPDGLAGSQTGVFVGISSSDYSRLQFSDPSYIDAYAGTGNAHSIAANRLSYQLDLRGPSIAIDTACSSSLVAVHLACQSLRNGECNIALAGGVNLILTPELTITFSQARMMSADGHCKTFDDDADGYVRAEGCGLVVLKPLADALRDGDRVLALIRGSAVNQDGRSNGLTAPNGPAQEAVIQQALRNARITPDQVSYVETHGSSTPLGDPIEFESLKAVMMQNRTADQPCLLGSVKTNIGHLESAAGIAGLIKAVLCLQKGEIAPHLHLKKLNQHISLEGTTFVIPTERQPWPANRRRIAGVSAFGFGGTNAHVILEEAPAPATQVNEVERSEHLLTLSARSPQALRMQARQYEEFLAAHPDVALADVCFTANSGRAHFAHRLAVRASDVAQMRERLAAFAAGQSDIDGVQSGQVQNRGRGKIAFLFTGQGSQYAGMGRQLYETQPTFRKALDRCDQILRSYLEQPLLSVLYPESGDSPLLHETAYTQPALFALEYALAEMWRSWGIEPDVVMGHSVGEYVAACVAGMFSLEDGLKLISERARLMQALPQAGEMAVVFAEQSQLLDALAPFREQVAIAAINGPNNIVLSGEREALHTILQRLEAQGLTTYPMTVSHAFHSPLMEPMLDAFEQVACQVHFEVPALPLVCNLTGELLGEGETLDAGYWRRQTRQAVQFAKGMQMLAEHGYDCFLELGPNAILTGMGKRCFPPDTGTWLASLRKDQVAWLSLLNSLATLYVKGGRVDWSGFDGDYQRHRLSLPTYPFEREYCWIETSSADRSSQPRPSLPAPAAPLPDVTPGLQRHPLLDTHVELVHPAGVHVWETMLDRQRLPYLNDHRIQGAMAVPVSVYVEMAQAATVEVLGAGASVLTEIAIKKLLLLPEKGPQKVQVVLSSDANEHVSFHVYSHSAGVPEQPRTAWTLHATGKIRHS